MKETEKPSEFPKTGLVVLCIIQGLHVFSCVDALNTGNSDTAFITTLNEQMYWVSKKPCSPPKLREQILCKLHGNFRWYAAKSLNWIFLNHPLYHCRKFSNIHHGCMSKLLVCLFVFLLNLFLKQGLKQDSSNIYSLIHLFIDPLIHPNNHEHIHLLWHVFIQKFIYHMFYASRGADWWME